MTKGAEKFAHRPSQFLDYKDYLKALYDGEKERLPAYSYVQFSTELGLGATNVSWLIVNGQRRLTRNTSQKIIAAIGLKGYEKQYFETMMLYTHAKDPTVIDALLQKLVSLKARCLDDVGDERVLQFYSRWHHAVVFEMVGLETFRSDPKWIQAKLNFHLSVREVQESLSMLEGLGLIRFDADRKRHVKLVTDFETKSEVQGIGVVQFHKKMIDLGKSTLETLGPELRDIGAVTVAVSPETVQRIKQEVQAFRSYLMFIASQSKNPTEIMQVNIQAFTITNPESHPAEDLPNEKD